MATASVHSFPILLSSAPTRRSGPRPLPSQFHVVSLTAHARPDDILFPISRRTRPRPFPYQCWVIFLTAHARSDDIFCFRAPVISYECRWIVLRKFNECNIQWNYCYFNAPPTLHALMLTSELFCYKYSAQFSLHWYYCLAMTSILFHSIKFKYYYYSPLLGISLFK